MNGDAVAAVNEPWRVPTALHVRSLLRWANTRLHSPVFWGVQVGVVAITLLHYYLEATGIWKPFETTVVMLYVVPVTVAALSFSREGGIATSIWAGLLTLPDIFLWHRQDFNWLEDAVPAAMIVCIGVVLASRVESETRQRTLTERARAELQRLASRYRSLFESAGDAVLVFDRSGHILLANPAASHQLGHSVTALQTSSLQDVLGLQAAEPLLHVFDSGDAEHDGDPRPGRQQIVVDSGTATAKVMDAAWAIVEDESHQIAAQAVLRDVTLQREREESLRLYAHQVTLAQERERQRIARELHDEPVQLLVSLCQGLDHLGVAQRTGREPPAPDTLREMAKQALDSVRRFARDLRPTLLDDLGLIAAIHWLVSDMGRRLGIEARMETAGSLRRLDAEVTLFRVVQEALHNTERHASASTVLVQVRFLPKSVFLTITDNGKGFTPPTALHSLVGEGHLGLLGMQERVQLLGGSLALSASPGRGVRIEVSVPDAAAPSAASI